MVYPPSQNYQNQLQAQNNQQQLLYWIDQHGRYWISNQASPSGATYATNSTYMGATSAGNQAAAYNPRASYPAVEDAGIRAGEIIGYRAWQLWPDLSLHSVYAFHIWSPKQSETVDSLLPINDHSGNGFHAFKDLAKAKLEYREQWEDGPVVYGEVALWGKVIEHERGYRAECARIVRLYSITTKPRWKDRLPNSTLKQLRRKYGV